MFADYRVPVVLRQLGILEYSPGLAAKVNLLPKCPYRLALLSPAKQNLLLFFILHLMRMFCQTFYQ